MSISLKMVSKYHLLMIFLVLNKNLNIQLKVLTHMVDDVQVMRSLSVLHNSLYEYFND